MTTPVNKNLLPIKTTPRIDISRASSSSYQEDSSPENELCSGKKNQLVDVTYLSNLVSKYTLSKRWLDNQTNDNT